MVLDRKIWTRSGAALAILLGLAACERAYNSVNRPQLALAPITSEERMASTRRRGEAPVPAFRPRHTAHLGREPGPSQQLAAVQRPSGSSGGFLTSPNPPKLNVPQQGLDGPLGSFRTKLAALEAGTRSDPVVIVHLGDSHVASDSFTRGIRSRLQARFGDAGRGAVIPANAFKYAQAQNVSLSSSGPWQSSVSLKSGSGVYGLSGVRVESAASSAVMKLIADQPFDWAQVTVVTGPGQGQFDVIVDGHEQRFSAKASGQGAKSFRVDRGGKTLSVSPAGGGKLSVLHWSTGKDGPGVRYVNFGQISATVSVTRRWNDQAIANDLAALKPDLIVYGFGTNEGYDDNVDPVGYRDYARGFLGKLKAGAPQADIMILGAADGLRRRGGKSCGNGWNRPPKLAALRDAMEGLAQEIDAGYWNWAQAMGGECSIDQWARSGLAAKDRVHLTSKGYDRSAEAFYQALVGPLDRPVVVADKR